MANCPATKRKPSLRVQRKENSRSVQWWTQVTVSPWKAAGILGAAGERAFMTPATCCGAAEDATARRAGLACAEARPGQDGTCPARRSA